MSIVNVTSIEVLDNPAKFADPYKLKVTFECLQELPEGVPAFPQTAIPTKISSDSGRKQTWNGS